MTSLQRRLGYCFVERERLEQALTHRSWCAENPRDASNERLEFLGDSVVGIIVTDHVFTRFPDLPEGQLAKTRASVVSTEALAGVGTDLGLGGHLRLGKGEIKSEGHKKESILADAVEAVFGAVYRDGGFEAAREVVLRQLTSRIDNAAIRPGSQDYKTRLQEIAAQDGHGPPAYLITESGPDHDKRFRAVVQVDGKDMGTGEGRSKKVAEQRAARPAYAARSALDGVSNV